MRAEYRHRLDELESSLQEQGAVVLEAPRGALEALISQDAELCDVTGEFNEFSDASH